MNEHASTRINSPAHEPGAERMRHVHVPTSHLGRIFAADHTLEAAKAVQMLAAKLSHADGFVLNQVKEAKPASQGGHSIPAKRFQAGNRHLGKAGVTDRRAQGGRRAGTKNGRYASETVAPAGDHYVAIPETLIAGDYRVLGFVAAALLSPKPVTAKAAARKIGIVGRAAIARLVEAAADADAIAAVRIVGDYMVGRSQAAVEAAAAPFMARRRPQPGILDLSKLDLPKLAQHRERRKLLQRPLKKPHRPLQKGRGRGLRPLLLRPPPAAAAEPRARLAGGGGDADDDIVLSDWRSAQAFGQGGLTLITAGVAVPEAHPHGQPSSPATAPCPPTSPATSPTSRRCCSSPSCGRGRCSGGPICPST